MQSVINWDCEAIKRLRLLLDQKSKPAGNLRIRVMKSPELYENNISLLEEMHLESAIGKRFAFERKRVDIMVKQLLASPDTSLILLAEWKGEVIGFVVCTINAFLSSSKAMIAHIHLLHIAAKWRKTIPGGKAILALMRAAINWAKAKGVAETRIELGEEAMNSKLSRVLMRSGFGVGGVSLVGGGL